MVIKIGHDEAIIKQFTLLKKAWYGPNGETALVPKDEGMGIMISAMMSREFGWGFELTPEQLAKVNEKRAGKTMRIQSQRQQKGEMQQKLHLPSLHSSESSNMELMLKATGAMSIWLCSWKTA